MDQASEAAERIGTLTSDITEAVKERPYTAAAVAGGLAFAIGALWMMRRHDTRSSYQALFSHLPDRRDISRNYDALVSRLPDLRDYRHHAQSWSDYLPRSWTRYWQ